MHLLKSKSIDLLIVMVDKYPQIFGLTAKKPSLESGWVVLNHTKYYEESSINTKTPAKRNRLSLRRAGCNA